jgi:hypothetical protein
LAWLGGASRPGNTLPDQIGVKDHIQGYEITGESQHHWQYDK